MFAPIVRIKQPACIRQDGNWAQIWFTLPQFVSIDDIQGAIVKIVNPKVSASAKNYIVDMFQSDKNGWSQGEDNEYRIDWKLPSGLVKINQYYQIQVAFVAKEEEKIPEEKLKTDKEAIVLTLEIPQDNTTVEFRALGNTVVDWGDGTIEKSKADANFLYPHTYLKKGNYVFILYNATRVNNSSFYRQSIVTSATIYEPIGTIDGWGFSNCRGLKSVFIADTVTTIGTNAFALCAMRFVRIPAAVTTLDAKAFYYCQNLEEVFFKNPTPIAYDSTWFLGCSKLSKIYVPSASVEAYREAWPELADKIDSADNKLIATFETTEEDTAVTIKSISGTTAIDWGDGNVEDTSEVNWQTDNVTHTYAQVGKYTCITQGTTSMGACAFNLQLPLTKIVWGDQVQLEGNSQFENCKNLSEVILPDELNLISPQMFKGSGFTEIILPSSTTEIGDAAFYDCKKLKQAIIPNKVTSIGVKAFYQCGKLAHLKISNKTTQILDDAFGSCIDLTRLIVPNSVTKIGTAAFAGCEKLISVTLPKTLGNIPDSCFASAKQLIDIKIPDTVYNVQGAAFKASGLQKVVLPPSVSVIGAEAFAKCKSLTEVTILNSNPPTYTQRWFAEATSLSKIYVPNAMYKDKWSELASLMVFSASEQNVDSDWSQISLIKFLPGYTTTISWSPNTRQLLAQVVFDEETDEIITQYQYAIVDGTEGEIYSSPMIDNFNSYGTVISTTLDYDFIEGTPYYSNIWAYTTNGLKIHLQTSEEPCGYPDAEAWITNISTQLIPECGGASVTINNVSPGTVQFQRTDYSSNFQVWETVAEIQNDEEDTTLTWVDCYVDGGKLYEYRAFWTGADGAQRLGERSRILTSFEDTFLSDADYQLTLKYNTNISGFKWVTQESVTNTLGGKYPTIRRNADTKYRQFNVSGTIAVSPLENTAGSDSCGNTMSQWVVDESDVILTPSPEIYQRWSDSWQNAGEYKDTLREKDIKTVVMSFLTNGKVKLYRSATEGNIIVYLSNISFTPNKTLNRQICDFSATVTEVCEATLENLKKYGIYKNIADYGYWIDTHELHPEPTTIEWKYYTQGLVRTQQEIASKTNPPEPVQYNVGILENYEVVKTPEGQWRLYLFNPDAGSEPGYDSEHRDIRQFYILEDITTFKGKQYLKWIVNSQGTYFWGNGAVDTEWYEEYILTDGISYRGRSYCQYHLTTNSLKMTKERLYKPAYFEDFMGAYATVAAYEEEQSEKLTDDYDLGGAGHYLTSINIQSKGRLFYAQCEHKRWVSTGEDITGGYYTPEHWTFLYLGPYTVDGIVYDRWNMVMPDGTNFDATSADEAHWPDIEFILTERNGTWIDVYYSTLVKEE